MLNDLDQGQGLSPEAVVSSAAPQTKQTAAAIGHLMAVMVATVRQLWLNLADIKEKERNFLLDVPILPSELFGTSVEMVVGKFREVRLGGISHIDLNLRLRFLRDPGLSQSEDWRQCQRESVATCSPLRTLGGRDNISGK